MVNFYMQAWSDPWGELTSQSWNTCLGYSTVVLSYHALVQKDFKQTSSGGSSNFDSLSLRGRSLNQFTSMTHMPFQMPAQVLKSPLPSEISGERGTSPQAGERLMGSETSAGQKLSYLSFWLDSSLMDKSRNDTLWYMGITEGSSKDGGMGGVVTKQSMKFSRDSMKLSGADRKSVV